MPASKQLKFSLINKGTDRALISFRLMVSLLDAATITILDISLAQAIRRYFVYNVSSAEYKLSNFSGNHRKLDGADGTAHISTPKGMK